MTAFARDGGAPRPRPTTLAGWLEVPTVVVGAAMVMAVVALLPLGPLQAVLNLPLVLLLPGHALLLAIGAPDRPLDLPGRLAARVVLSLALVGVALVAVGSLLRLERPLVILTVWGLVVAFGLVASVRDQPVVDGDGSGVTFLPEPRREPFARLSVTGPTQDEGTPLRIDTARAVVHVEVENGDDRAHRFGVVAAVDGGAQWESVAERIPAGETWRGAVEGRLPPGACLSRLRVSLTRDGEPAGVNPLILYLRNERGTACR